MNDNTVVNNIVMLLKQQHKTQKELTQYLGITQNAMTDWKSGRIKSYTKHLPKIAEFFGVTTDRLIGSENAQILSAPNSSDSAQLSLTAHERSIIIAYRAQPDIRTAVDRLLGIEDDGFINVYTAAHSEDNHPDKIVRMRNEQWEKIKNAPQTDDPLI